MTRPADQLREPGPAAFELAAVRRDLGAARPTLDQDVAHECKAAQVEQEIVDLPVEERFRIGVEQGHHAASSTSSSSCMSSGSTATACGSGRISAAAIRAAKRSSAVNT